MTSRVQFDPETRIIQFTDDPAVSGSIITVDVQEEIYSEAKEQWLVDAELNRLIFPFTTIGGEDLGTDFAGRYFFLRNDLGWRIRPFSATYELRVVGNLYGTTPNIPVAIPPDNDFKVLMVFERAALSIEAKSTFTQTDRTELEEIRPYISPLYSKL